MDEVIHKCTWKGVLCGALFQEIWTEQGLCFTFNIVNASELYRINKLSTA